MRAFEISTKTDESGRLRLDYELGHVESSVRVLILLDDEEPLNPEEREWLSAVSSNPAFAFLADPAEDIYGEHDGTPIE